MNYGKTIGVLLLTAFSLPSLTASAAETLDAQQLLSASDSIRNPNKPFSLTTALVEFRNGTQKDSSTLRVYSKSSGDGQFNSLVQFKAPSRDKNKLLLKNGNELWFYDPSSQSSVRISPRLRLLGQAANGDVVTVNWSADYVASIAGLEDIEDGDQKTRHCHKLSLRARTPDVTYNSIDLWLDTADNKPVKARFYTESGTLLKTAYYRKFSDELGASRPTETIIIDGLDPQWVTVLRFSNYAWQTIPDEWMQRAYLQNFHGD